MATFALTSCVNDEFIGGNDATLAAEAAGDGSINFGFKMKNATRADIYGQSAATLLGNNFYVTGTKGTEPSLSPTTSLVFDNYLVHYGVNTAGTTESNTANWEYVGIDQTVPTVADRVKLSSTSGAQTIKYWDYSVAQYDFLAFSTGTFAAVSGSSTAPTNIGVTPMAYGDALKSSGIAYTFDLPNTNALKNAFISDITEVKKTDGKYGKEVTLRFKNLGSKVRMALYETVPGYSVKDVKFYRVDGTNADLSSATTYDESYLIGDNSNSFPTAGKIKVYFPHVGTTNHPEADYDVAAATVEPKAVSFDKWKTFGALTAQLVGKDRAEKKETSPGVYAAEDGKVFLGRALTEATYAGSKDAAFYETVFPVSTAYPLTLRVDYTLVPIDGATETIKVYGARAVVPSTYTKWLPNYAYTYIFKISDNTNGWTSTLTTDPAGLFPITFDAVVAEATDVTGEQTTITTVATPTITTYQQGHNPNKDGKVITATDEYSKAGEKLYVQVMDNSTSPASLVDDLDEQNNDLTPTDRSLLYLISRSATEAEVMDALQNRTTDLTAGDVIGRNGITLTKADYITNNVTSIVNGVDDNPITVGEGEAAEIAIGSLTENRSYAYVYDYSTAARNVTNIYQPITVIAGTTIVDGKQYVANTDIAAWDDADPSHYTSSENAAAGFLYFSITKNGGASPTYSFISVDDKIGQPLADGLLKLSVSALTPVSGTGQKAVAGNSYFDTYLRNDGKYAVKVIKIVP